MKKHFIKASVVVGTLLPLAAFAQVPSVSGSLVAITTLQGIVQGIGAIINALLPIIFALAIVAFFYGIFQYVFAHSIDGKKSGRNIMLWSLIAIFIMASLFGLIRLAQTSLGIDTAGGTLNPVHVQ